MNDPPLQILTSERLILRHWREEDLEPFARMNADARVMEFFPACLSAAESDVLASRIQRALKLRGWGLWAVELKGDGSFAGFTGLAVPSFEAAFQPCVEIGWRLAPSAWGQGIATEAAIAVRDYAFHGLGLPEIVSFTAAGNLRSRRVMEKIGMTHDPLDDFEHPGLPAGHRLRHHVLYRLRTPLLR